ncbi:MAG: HD domain-containing protein [Nitrososphaerota archaeon]|nr:HD domain-containing protein [Nitrososphaerota archaeon]
MDDDLQNAANELSKSIPLLNLISDTKIRFDTSSVFVQLLHESKWKTLEEQPIVSSIRVSGLEHVNTVVELCVSTAEILRKFHKVQINMDYLISGAVLHDASKLVEYEPTESGERKTKLGELGQHTIRCVSLMLSKNMPMEIVHIVLTHTPQSASMPKTIESVILYFADSTDYNVLRINHGLAADIKK